MKKNDIDEMYPRESFPVVTPSPKTSGSYPSASGHLSKVIKLPNLNDWSSEQEQHWAMQDLIEVERYYLNTHNNIKKMKKSPKGKPTLLIAKKKEWRDGLGKLLVTGVKGYKLVHTPRDSSTFAPTSATTVSTIVLNKTETPTTTPTSAISIQPSAHGRTLGIRRPRPMIQKSQKIEEEGENWHVDYNNE